MHIYIFIRFECIYAHPKPVQNGINDWTLSFNWINRVATVARIFQRPGIDLPISLGSGNEGWRDVWISLELERILRISETLGICETYGNSFFVILSFFLLHEDLACCPLVFSHLPSFLTCFFFSFSAEVENPTLIGMLRYKNTSLSVKSPCRVLAVQPFEQRKLRVFYSG